MFKMTWVTRADRGQTLKLEGDLLEPWVDAVRNACAEPEARARRLRLDLSGVTFVDAAGVELLRGLLRQGIEISTCSSFVAELLHESRPRKPQSNEPPPGGRPDTRSRK